MFSVEYSCFCICELQAKMLWRVASNCGTSSESVSLVMTRSLLAKNNVDTKKLQRWNFEKAASRQVHDLPFSMPLHGFSPNGFTGFQWGFHLFPYTFKLKSCFLIVLRAGDCPMHGKRKNASTGKKAVSTSPLTSHQYPSLFRHHLSEAAPENRAGHVVSACSHVLGNHKCSAIENAQKCSKKGLSINVGKHELRKNIL